MTTFAVTSHTVSVDNLNSIEPDDKTKIVLADTFEESAVDTAFREFFAGIPKDDTDSRLHYFTPPHIGWRERMGLFGDFAPSVVYAANRHHELHLPYRESTMQEFAYSKLCHLYCTLDKSIMFEFYNRHTAMSKVRNLNSVATIMGFPDLCIDDSPLEESGIPEDQVLDILFHVKKNATVLLKHVRPEVQGGIRGEAKPHELAYPAKLEEIVGRSFAGVLLYGSSAAGAGNDFDNFAVLNMLYPDLYARIRGSKPRESDKEVGVIFVPRSVLRNFLYINVSNHLFKTSAKVLKGAFEFPNESPRYTIFKEMYHAGFGSAKLLSGLNLVYRQPEVFFDKPGLFEYFMKLNRFTLHGLMQRNGHVVLPKEEVLAILRDDYGFPIPKFRPDAKYLQESFVSANRASVALAQRLYDPSLAQQGNEQLVEVGEQVASRIFRARNGSRPIYVFRGLEEIHEGDVVPAQILTPDDVGYLNRRRGIRYRGIETSANFDVARRV